MCSEKRVWAITKYIDVPHSQLCEGECTSSTCTHRSHKSRQPKKQNKTQQQQQKQQHKKAILAGFKPNEDQEFKEMLKVKMEQAGVER